MELKYQVSGIVGAWEALCKNITTQKDLFRLQLTNLSNTSSAYNEATKCQAEKQAEALEASALGMRYQGWTNIVSGGAGFVTAFAGFYKGSVKDEEAATCEEEANDLETKANNLEKASNTARMNLSEVSPENSSVSSSESSSEEETRLQLRKNSNKENSEVNPQSRLRDDDHFLEEVSSGRRLDEQASVGISVEKQTTAKQNLDQDISVREQAAADDKRTADMYRRKADIKRADARTLRKSAEDSRAGGQVAGQSINTVGQGIGNVWAAKCKDDEADATKRATLYQGSLQILQTIISQIQAMLQAFDTSLQGTLSAFSSIMTACIIRG